MVRASGLLLVLLALPGLGSAATFRAHLRGPRHGLQRPRQTIRFPPGVAVALGPHQRLLLNSHYLNGSSEPVTIDVAVNFVAARKRTVSHHTRSFQLGTFNIDVPPGQTGSASASWLTPFPMNVVWLSTHSHKHTQTADIDLVRQGAVGPQELETRSYSEPTVNE